MALPRHIIEPLIESGKIKIEPFSADNLTNNSYKLHVGKVIKQCSNSDLAANTASDTAKKQVYDTYEIPKGGFVISPRYIYILQLEEKVTTSDYSGQLVPSPDLAAYGVSINISGNITYQLSGTIELSLTSTQPVIIYPGNTIAEIYFTPASDGSGLPVGGIIMWSGSTVPLDWHLCDGEDGTPDLRNRFIVGIGGSYTMGNTGGSNAITLTEAQMPTHSHTLSLDMPSGSGTGSGGSKIDNYYLAKTVSSTGWVAGTHGGKSVIYQTFTDTAGYWKDNAYPFISYDWTNDTNVGNKASSTVALLYDRLVRDASCEVTTDTLTLYVDSSNTTLVSALQSTNIPIVITGAASNGELITTTTGEGESSSVSAETDSVGGSQEHENRPPYYALAFIMRMR